MMWKVDGVLRVASTAAVLPWWDGRNVAHDM